MSKKQSILLALLLIALLPFTVYAADKGNPPIAYWRFDECGGGTTSGIAPERVRYENANNNDGTLHYARLSEVVRGCQRLSEVAGCVKLQEVVRGYLNELSWYDECDNNQSTLSQPPLVKLQMQQITLSLSIAPFSWLDKEASDYKCYRSNTQSQSQSNGESFKEIACKTSSFLFENFCEFSFDMQKCVFWKLAYNFTNKPFIYRNNLTNLYYRRFRQSTGPLVNFIQEQVKFAYFWSDVRSNSQNNDIVSRVIECLGGNNKSGSLFSSRKVSEGKRDEDNLVWLIGYHTQNPQDYPRSQKNFQLISKEINPQERFSKDAAVLSRIFAVIPQEISESLALLLLKMDSLYFTSNIKFTTDTLRCQGYWCFGEGGGVYEGDWEIGGLGFGDLGIWGFGLGDFGIRGLGTKAYLISQYPNIQIPISQSPNILKRILCNISDWLCPSVYAADKGNPPVAYWRFDEGGGPTAYDDSANNNDGTLSATPAGTNTSVGQMWTRQGKIGGALECDGTDDKITTSGGNNIIYGSGDFYVGGWFYFKNNTKGWQFFLEGRSNSDGTGWIFYTETSNQLSFISASGAGWNNFVLYNTGVVPTINTWSHLAVTRAGNTFTMYVNGRAIKSGSFSGSIEQTAVSLDIGNSHVASTPGAFNGLIDDVRIYNYARTADQIMVDYNAGMATYTGAGTDPNEGNPPVRFWKFDEGSGQSAYDRSGSGNNGQLGATSGAEGSDPIWTAGKHGGALSFDGTPNYLKIPTSNDFAFGTGNFSIDYWVYPTAYSSLANCFFDFRDGTNGAYFSDQIYNQKYRIYVNSGVLLDSVASIPLNIWTHIAVSRSGTSLKVFLNGNLDTTITDSTNYLAPAANVWFGISSMSGQQTSACSANGKIDDVKIYNYARTQAQIAYDYNKGKPVAHYKFDEGGGSIARNEYSTADTGTAPVALWKMDNNWNDSSGYGNNGTANGGATFSASSKIGPYCGSFDGTDDYVNIPSYNGIDRQIGSAVLWFNDYDITKSTVILLWGYDGFQILTSGSSLYVRVGGSQASKSIATWQNQWHQVAVVWFGSGKTFYVYFDGVQAFTGTQGGAAGDNSLWIGHLIGTSQQFSGLIDDVRIYNYARTPEQIYNDYKTTHGTLVGDTKFVDGKIGKALQFDGNGDYVMMGDLSSANFERTDSFTLAAWVKNTSTSWRPYIIKSVGASPYTGYWFRQNSTNNVSLQLYETDGSSYIGKQSVATINDGVWHHAVATYSGTSTNAGITLYIDGNLAPDTDFGGGSGFNTSMQNSQPLKIGSDNQASPNYFNGLIDDVRIYNYARTQEQVMQDFNEGKAARLGAQSTGVADPWGGALPIAHWKLDENTGVLAYDASGNGNNGTLGGDGAGTDVPIWTQGKNGPCLSFDKVDDYVNVGHSNVLDITTSITLAGWVKINSIAGHQTLISKNGIYNLYVGANDGSIDARLTIGGIDRSNRTSSSVFNAGQWGYVVTTYTSGDWRIYLNGRLVQSTSAYTGAISSSPSVDVTIGNNAAGYILGGLIDDVRIYNYARTQAQIAWDYNKGKPVGYWRFDEKAVGQAVDTSSGAIKDDSDNNNDGTASNTTWSYTTGKFGGALSFDGNDYVSVSDASSLKPANIAISAWIKLSAVLSSQPYAYPLVIDKYTLSSNTGYSFLFDKSGDYFIFRLLNGSAIKDVSISSAGAKFGTGWHHVVGTFDGAVRKVYLDGKVENSTTESFSISYATETLYIGSYDGSTHFINGLIDDVRIYNYARTAEQIGQDYNQGMAARLGD